MNLVLFDIDDTLVTAQNIYILKINKHTGEVVKLAPDQYRHEDPSIKNDYEYSYIEFRDAEKVRNSILTGKPLVKNLQQLDKAIEAGDHIGLLTARGMEEVVYETMKEFLRFRHHETKKLHPIGDHLQRHLVFAINDDDIKYKEKFKVFSDADCKLRVIIELSKTYEHILFIDDDLKNINAVKQANIPGIFAVEAHKE